jgi:hypothetical protein
VITADSGAPGLAVQVRHDPTTAFVLRPLRVAPLLWRRTSHARCPSRVIPIVRKRLPFRLFGGRSGGCFSRNSAVGRRAGTLSLTGIAVWCSAFGRACSRSIVKPAATQVPDFSRLLLGLAKGRSAARCPIGSAPASTAVTAGGGSRRPAAADAVACSPERASGRIHRRLPLSSRRLLARRWPTSKRRGGWGGGVARGAEAPEIRALRDARRLSRDARH